MQIQGSLSSIPSDKQDGPIFAVITATGAHSFFDNAHEADNLAAQLFSAGSGKMPVFVFGLLKVAKPAIPKVEFTEAKKA